MSKFTRREMLKSGPVLAAAAGIGASGQVLASQDDVRMDPMDPNHLNVLNFGAVGDGRKNDTAAIQKALDAAAKIEGTVFVPSGVYLCSELQMHPGTGIVGTPAWDYRISRGSILQLDDSKPKSLLNLTGAYGATVQGMCLRGNGPSEETVTHGIMVDKPDPGEQEDTPRIDCCKIEQFSGDGIHFEWIWCFTVRHSHCRSNGGCGIRLRGWDGFILDNWFSGNRMCGFGAYGANASITMTGNRIEWNYHDGILVMGGAQYNITGNYIDRSGKSALAIIPRGEKGCHHFAMTGNVIYRSGKPARDVESEFQNSHVRLEGSDSLVFTSNTMYAGRDDRAGGQWSPDYGIVLEGLSYSIIKDNILHEGALKKLVVDKGGHGPEVIIKDNVGALKTSLKNRWES